MFPLALFAAFQKLLAVFRSFPHFVSGMVFVATPKQAFDVIEVKPVAVRGHGQDGKPDQVDQPFTFGEPVPEKRKDRVHE